MNVTIIVLGILVILIGAFVYMVSKEMDNL